MTLQASCLRLTSRSRAIARTFDAERCENAPLSGLPVPFHHVEHGAAADSEITRDPAAASSLAGGLKGLRRETIFAAVPARGRTSSPVPSPRPAPTSCVC